MASSSTPRRILHYYGTNYGMTGVESFILQLATAQKRTGLEPGITIDIEHRADLVRWADKIDVPVYGFPGAVRIFIPGLKKFARVASSLRRIGALRKLLKGYDVLHVHAAGFTGTDALVAGALARVPKIIVTNHMTVSAYRRYWRRLGTLTLWLVKRIADASVMPYEEAAQELLEVGLPPAKVRVIPYCVDQARFCGHNTPPEPGGPLTLIMVSRLHEGKGHDVLLDALGQLKAKGRAVRLLIVGQGDTRLAIERQIEALGLQSLVQMRAHVDHAAVPSLLESSHVIVLPSWMEGETFPLCLLEAALIGLPAIGARWHGIPSIIEDGRTGFLVTPQDPHDLAEAIDRFLTDPLLYPAMSARARQRALANYTAGKVAETYSALYAEQTP